MSAQKEADRSFAASQLAHSAMRPITVRHGFSLVAYLTGDADGVGSA